MHFAEIKLGQRIKNVYINLQTKSKVCFKILVLSANGVETQDAVSTSSRRYAKQVNVLNLTVFEGTVNRGRC